MELCSDERDGHDGHDEICYDARMCPVCSVRSDLKSAEEKIDDLNKQIKDLNTELKSKEVS